MKTTASLLLALLFAAASANADEPKPDAKKSENAQKKEKTGKAEKNAAQKAEASVTKWANDNKIWITHPDKSGKKSEK